MRLELIKKIIDMDQIYDLHLVRLMILVNVLTGRMQYKRVEGITKLVKLDFLLRYPIALERALESIGQSMDFEITDSDKKSIESRMIRYKYGPWDRRYRLFLAILDARGFLRVINEKETVMIEITEKGQNFAKSISNIPEFETYVKLSSIIKKHFGNLTAIKLKNMMYEIIPEMAAMNMGEIISL